MAKRPRTTRPQGASPHAAPLSRAAPLPDIGCLWALGLALLWVLVLLAPSLPDLFTHYLGSETTDMRRAYRHFIAFMAASVRGGEWPAWNPFIFCGAPFLPGTSCAVFDPLAGPFILQGGPLGVNLAIIAHGMLLSAGMLVLARVRGCSNTAGLFAALAATGGSLFACRVFAGHFTIVTTLCWAPLVFAAQELVFRRGLPVAPLFGVACGLLFFGGHAQYVYYAGLLLGLGLLLRTAMEPAATRRAWAGRAFASHGVAALVAFGIGAVELLPLADTVRFSARRMASSPEWLRHFSMPPENLLTLFAPGLFGDHVQYWGRWFWWETCYYVGIPGLILGAAGLVSRLRRECRDAFPWLAIVALLLAMAGFIPLLDRAVAFLPGWGLFRGHTKIGSFALLLLCALAAHAVDALRTRPTGRLTRGVAVAAGALALAALLGLLAVTPATWVRYLTSPVVQLDRTWQLPIAQPDSLAAFSRAVADATRATLIPAIVFSLFTGAAVFALTISHRRALPLLLLLMIAALDLCWFAWEPANSRFDSRSGQPPVELVNRLRTLSEEGRMEVATGGLVNNGMTWGVRGFGGNDVTIPRFINTFIHAYLGSEPRLPHLDVSLTHDAPLLDPANVRYLLLPPDDEAAPAEGLRHVMTDAGVAVWERTGALPRAWVVGRARRTGDSEQEVWRALVSAPDFRNEVLLTGAPAEAEGGAAIGFEPATVTPQGLHAMTVTPPRTGWLVLAEAWYPHWRAEQGGRPLPVYRANGAFRAVRAEAGTPVVFTYSNPAVYAGRVITLATLAMLGGWGVFLAVRRRRAQVGTESPGASTVTGTED